MRTIHDNGEFWHEDDRSLLKRIGEWCVWFGGWSRFHKFTDWPLAKRLRHLTPISILGHRATFFGHWFNVKVSAGWLVVNLRERYAFVSRDGTPQRAHVWLRGAPAGIRRAAAERSPCPPAPSEHFS